MEKSFCEKCGAELNDENSVCATCSVEVTEATKPQENTNPEKKSSKAIKRLSSILLCFIAFWLIFATVFTSNVRFATSKNGMENLIKKIVFTSVSPENDNEASESLADSIHKEIIKSPELQSVTKEQVEKYIKKSTFMPFFAEKMSGIVGDLYSGENSVKITEDELAELIDENKWILEENDIEVPENFSKEIAAVIIETDTIKSFNENGLQESVGNLEFMGIVKTVTSIPVLLSATAACLLIFGLIWLINRKRPISMLLYGGWTLITSGAFYLSVWALIKFLPKAFNLSVGIAQYVFTAINHVLNSGMIISVIFVVLSIAMFTVYAILKRKLKKTA